MKSNIKKIRNDIILAIGILTIAIISLIWFNNRESNGSNVNVIINGKVKYKYSLQDDVNNTIKTQNDGKNVLVINDNKVYVSSANCRDKICVNHKPISNSGETIVCLPHKLVIEITDEK